MDERPSVRRPDVFRNAEGELPLVQFHEFVHITDPVKEVRVALEQYFFKITDGIEPLPEGEEEGDSVLFEVETNEDDSESSEHITDDTDKEA